MNKFESLFNDALKYVKPLNVCSSQIIFNGLVDFNHYIKMESNNQIFNIQFSNQYINNEEKKIKNVFIRYILTTNVDGSFKTFKQLKKVIQQTQNFELLKTFQPNYLTSNIKEEFNSICTNCFNKYNIPNDENNYYCVCGGKIQFSSQPIFNKYYSIKYNDKEKPFNFNNIDCNIKQFEKTLQFLSLNPTNHQIQAYQNNIQSNTIQQLLQKIKG